MPSVNLLRKRSKIESQRGGRGWGGSSLHSQYTKNTNRSRKARGLPKRSVIRRRHNHIRR